jgi:hypothetical protein
VADELVVLSTGPLDTLGALAVPVARGCGPEGTGSDSFEIPVFTDSCGEFAVPVLEAFALGELDEPALVGDVTVEDELAGHPRFSSDASCARA